MIELYQAEWCPHSSLVRERLTELGVSYVAHQVPVDREDRVEMRDATGADTIPVLVLEDGTALTGDAKEIVAALGELYDEPPEAEAHRQAARAHGL